MCFLKHLKVIHVQSHDMWFISSIYLSIKCCCHFEGFLLFFRGIVNYLKVRNLPENMVASSRIRFYFLY